MRRTDGAAGAGGNSDAAASAAGLAPRLMSTTLRLAGPEAAAARSAGWLAGAGLGVSAGSSSSTAAAAGGAAAAGAAAAAAFGSGAFGSAALACGALPPAAPSSTLRIAWPTLTLSPTLTLMSLTWPATDEGTSMVALSVSSSMIG